MNILPARALQGRVTVPGDKSISHRAALIAALGHGESVLQNFSTSDDCQVTLNCLSALGVSIEKKSYVVRIKGVGLRGFTKPAHALDCGNSGSTMRMLAGILAGQDFSCELTGDSSLLQRPMDRIIAPLEMMGARIESHEGRPPLIVTGSSTLQSINYELPIASAQLKTSVLFAGLLAEGRTTVIESQKTRDHTERVLSSFSIPIQIDEVNGSRSIAVTGPAQVNAAQIDIPGDFSSAAYFIAATLLTANSKLEIANVGVNPTRSAFAKTLQGFGANIEFCELEQKSGEPVAMIGVRSTAPLTSSTQVIAGEAAAAMIDELPLLAVVGTQLPGGLVIRDAAELRVKETDRITATADNLRAMGAEVEEYRDGLKVEGAVQLKGAHLNSFGDHRIAMAFTVAALIAEGESTLIGSECVSVSFPGFFETLEAVIQR